MFIAASGKASTVRDMLLKDLALPSSSEHAVRDAFLEGVKAAFIVSQKNRLGQVLCANCGRACDTVAEATSAMGLRHVLGDAELAGYDPALGWGNDDPNKLMLCCLRCVAEAT